MKRHEQIHTGLKPYICKHCNMYFSDFSNCKKHEQTHAEFSLANIVKSVLASHKI